MTDYRWIFGDMQGTTCYDIISGQVGNLGPDVSWVSGGRYGFGAQVQMQATSNSYVDFGVPPGQFGTNVFTVMFWFVASDASVPLWDVLTNRNEASAGNFFCMRMNSSGVMSAEVCEDESGTNYAAVSTTGAALNDNNWHHIAVVRAGPSLTVYVDGVLNNVGAAESGNPANISNNNTFRLGCSVIMQQTGACRYTDLCVFQDQMADADIAHIFHFH